MEFGFSPKFKTQILKSLFLALGCMVWALGAAAQEAPSTARLTFTKVLQGSTPEFEEVILDSTGSATYDGRKLSDPPAPRSITLSTATTQRVFALVHALNDLDSIDLESHKKVANLGRKTFTYERGGRKSVAEFNYTLRREAQELAEMFEKIAAVEEHIKLLEYDCKYDPLSLPRELLLIQIDLGNKGLLDAELMTPVLEQIARNSRFLHLAQARAQDILQRIQSSN
jgi:hypothetical protein